MEKPARINYFDYDQIPEHLMLSMKMYCKEGQHMGGFLRACFEGDLFKAVANADDHNMPLIPMYVRWIKWYAPIGCVGSYENVKAWKGNGVDIDSLS